MDKMYYKTKVSLNIFSEEHSAENISNVLGLKFSTKKIKGENIVGKLKERHNIWTIDSRLPQANNLEDHILDILEQIQGKAQNFSKLSKDYKVQCSCTIDANGEPPINLPPQILLGLGRIGAVLDIDQYISRDVTK